MNFFKNSTTIFLMVVTLFNCSIENEKIDQTEFNKNPIALLNQVCFTTNLIAGQHHTAGTVTVTSNGTDLIITYTTNSDWVINATHMSIGDCGEIPTTGSGNPKIGHFEYSTSHEEGVTEVSYYVPLSTISENYCLATHAEVTGPTGGETAWGEGSEFDGNSWAMFIEATLSSCNNSPQ